MDLTKTTRRQFLKTTVASAAGAAAAGPIIWTGRAAAVKNKNNRPRLAIIGCGGKGRDLVHLASQFGDFVACCDVDQSRAEAFSAGKMDTYGDYRKLLERNDLDAVINATPDHWHTGINIAALRAGLGVYGEKPLTLTIGEGIILRRVLKETDGIFQVGAQQRSGPWFRRAIAIARSGRLGKKVTATCTLGTGKAGGPFMPSDPPEGLNWDFWLGQAPKTPYITQRCHKVFRWWFEYSGGEVTDWGAHHVDIAQWGIGAEDTGPVEINAKGLLDTRKDCYNTAQTFDCTLKFANGNTIVIRDGKSNGIEFKGDNGKIFVSRTAITGDFIENTPRNLQDRITAETARLYTGPLGIADDQFPLATSFGGDLWGKVKTSHMANFFNCLDQHRQPISNVPSVHRTISTCHLCNLAIRLNRKLRWDPKKEDFIADEQASGMINRKQRRKYRLEA